MQKQFDATGDDRINLFGLDVGSTTCSAMVASARILKNCITGRRELGEVENILHSDPEFTPLLGTAIDESRLRQSIDCWIGDSGLDPAAISSGGAIVTGFAAQASNAAVVARLVRERFGESLIVTADDPCLESWLAFMGNSLFLSREYRDRTILNIDIGGGTTNLAWGLNGEVVRAGSFFVGARHLLFQPGSYRIVGVSSEWEQVLPSLGVKQHNGEELTPANLDVVLEFFVSILEAAAMGESIVLNREPAKRLRQVPFEPIVDPSMIITLSGGVGELAYRCARGEPLPETTLYGDLGIDFARRLCESNVFVPHLQQYVPSNRGRATVYGITVHNTEVSGSTFYLPHQNLLPLSDLPIVGRLTGAMQEDDVRSRIEIARTSSRGACLIVDGLPDDVSSVKSFGSLLATLLQEGSSPSDRLLVLLVTNNVGKTLGHYVTDWGRLPVRVIVVDEIPTRNANFVSLGKPRDSFIPVSFYGIQPGGPH